MILRQSIAVMMLTSVLHSNPDARLQLLRAGKILRRPLPRRVLWCLIGNERNSSIWKASGLELWATFNEGWASLGCSALFWATWRSGRDYYWEHVATFVGMYSLIPCSAAANGRLFRLSACGLFLWPRPIACSLVVFTPELQGPKP